MFSFVFPSAHAADPVERAENKAVLVELEEQIQASESIEIFIETDEEYQQCVLKFINFSNILILDL
jgi:hypothetical protein